MSFAHRVNELQQQIIQLNYYIELWDRVLLRHGMTQQGVAEELYAPLMLHEALNRFWFALPDTSSIRRNPFFMLCDLCEEEVDDDNATD